MQFNREDPKTWVGQVVRYWRSSDQSCEAVIRAVRSQTQVDLYVYHKDYGENIRVNVPRTTRPLIGFWSWIE